jgi:hypothetical protein
MIGLIEEGVISGKIAKDALPRLLAGEGNGGVRAFVEGQGLVQISGASRAGAGAGRRARAPAGGTASPPPAARGWSLPVLRQVPGNDAGLPAPPPHAPPPR